MVTKPPKDRRGLRVVPDPDDGAKSLNPAQLTVHTTLGFRTELKVAAAEIGETMSDFAVKAIRERISARKGWHRK